MTTAIPNPELDECSTCGRTRTWHKANRTMHGFSEPGSPSNLGKIRTDDRGGPFEEDHNPRKQMKWNAGDGRPRVRQVQSTMDPVLRMALVDKGMLTLEELDVAERKIHFFTGGLSSNPSGNMRGGDDGRSGE